MKANLICSMIAMSAVSLTAAAEDFSWGNVTFQPRAYAGYANYTLESGDMTVTQDNGTSATRPLRFALPDHSEIKISGPLGGLGDTVASGRFFGDIYYQSTLNETAYSSEQITQPNKNEAYYGDVDAQHSDWALSLGYQFTDQWSLFAGYKSGNTDWNQPFRIDRPDPDFRTVQDGNFSVKFDQDGPFVGTSYSFLIGPGALTLKAAYAYLNGTYTSDFNAVCRPPNNDCPNAPLPTLQQFNWGGNSNAFSVGASWTQAITDNLGVSIGANYHRYKFDTDGTQSFDNYIGGQRVGGGSLEGGNLTEKLFTLTSSLLYTF